MVKFEGSDIWADAPGLTKVAREDAEVAREAAIKAVIDWISGMSDVQIYFESEDGMSMANVEDLMDAVYASRTNDIVSLVKKKYIPYEDGCLVVK